MKEFIQYEILTVLWAIATLQAAKSGYRITAYGFGVTAFLNWVLWVYHLYAA